MTPNVGQPFKLAIFGECMAELSGELFSVMKQDMGGDTLNTAIYLKSLVKDAVHLSYVTAMGTDRLSQAMIKKWQEYNIDTNLVLTNKQKQVGLYCIQNDTSGERSFQYWRNDSAARYLMQHEGITDTFIQISQFNAVFLSGISIAILPPKDRYELLTHLITLKQLGVKVIFDGNYRAQLWENIETAETIYQELYHISDVALLTFDDEQLLWQDDNIRVTQQRLSDYKINELVIKDGKNGCIYLSKQQIITVPTKPVANVVDTTAAGDSFNAGFLAGKIKHRNAKDCCDLGNQLAGQVIQQQGAIVDVALDI